MKEYRDWRLGVGVLALALTAASTPALAAESGGPPHFRVPAGSSPGSFTFVVYGDTRFTEREQVANPVARRALVERIALESPAAILIGGDLIYTGTSWDDYLTYQRETAEWARHRIPVFPALGNHEFTECDPAGDDSVCLRNWWAAFAQLELRPWRWYSVSLGSRILALVLDSDSALKPGSEQRAWLERELAAAEPRIEFILIVLHYPPVRDAIFPRARDEHEVERYLSANAAMLRARVIVIGSHVHNYERFSREGVTYLVSGGGGAKPIPDFRMGDELSHLKTSVNFHYLRFTLENERLSGTMVRFDPADATGNPWSEPDRFEVAARQPPAGTSR